MGGMTDKQFLDVAFTVAATSKCVSLQVGAAIVKEGRIISIGYNGTPAGYPNCNEIHTERGHVHTEWSNKYEIHAEMNALLFASRNGTSTLGSTLYCTTEPCHQCIKNMVVAGISRAVYFEGYYREEIDRASKMEFALQCGLKLEQFSSGSTTLSVPQVSPSDPYERIQRELHE